MVMIQWISCVITILRPPEVAGNCQPEFERSRKTVSSPYWKGLPMGCAEVISLSEVRARKQWDGLRQELHTRFDQWLDDLEARLPEPETTLAAVSDLVWQLRQDLTGGLPETLLTHAYAGEQSRRQAPCPQCERLITARPAATRTVETMVGAMVFARPYFYCRLCQKGFYPFDSAVNLAPGRLQLDVQQAAAKTVIEMPYDEAQTFFHDLDGV